MRITPGEVLLIGHWVIEDDRIIADETCRRISVLVREHLKEIGRDASGWNVLYVDPDDGRLWELTYPEAESHGGGPPQLSFVALDEAKSRYPEARIDK